MINKILSKLKKSKIAETDILNEIYRVCDKNNIKCYLYENSLYGDMRLEGFIPCDGYIVILMPKEDYERFAKIAPRELKDGYSYQDHVTNPELPHNYAKVIMDNTITKKTVLSRFNIRKGIWIDIFPI